MKEKAIFFTSDLHLGHKNVLTFDNRPFKSLEEMQEGLIKRFNNTVPENGITYFLGDIGLGNSEYITDFLNRTNGTKVLILGNHDKGMFANYVLGFDVVLNSASFFIGNERVTMSHCPLIGIKREDTSEFKRPDENWHGEFKNNKFSIQNEDQFHLHGHIHSPNGGKSEKIHRKQFDIGVTANNYSPVSFKTIHQWIMKYKE